MEELHAQAIQFLDAAEVNIIDKIPGIAVLVGVSLFASTLTFTAGFGGGLSSALLLMRPDIIPVNFFTGYTDLVFTVCWWLSNYFPYNIPGRIVRTAFVTEITKLLVLVTIGKVMTNRLDTTLHLHPQATIGALVVGSLGGCGGKIVNDIIRGGYHLSKGTDEMRAPGIPVIRAVLCSTLYYALVHVYNVLKPRQGTTLVILLLWAHTLIMDLTGINPLQPLVTVFHTILNIPQPISPTARPTVKPPKPPTAVPASKKTT